MRRRVDVAEAASLLKPFPLTSAGKRSPGWVVSPSRSRMVLLYSKRVSRRIGAAPGEGFLQLAGGSMLIEPPVPVLPPLPVVPVPTPPVVPLLPVEPVPDDPVPVPVPVPVVSDGGPDPSPIDAEQPAAAASRVTMRIGPALLRPSRGSWVAGETRFAGGK